MRYAERKRLAETGSLGDFAFDESPVSFRNALWYLVFRPASTARTNMLNAMTLECEKYFGWPGDVDLSKFIASADTDDLLSLVEILCEYGPKTWDDGYHGQHRLYVEPLPQVETDLNHLFERHRFGYRIEGGEVRKVSSPLLEDEIVGPSLFASRKPGWEQVERSFKEALEHQRAGETDDALTAAHASVEAALKAVGMSGQFSTMTRQFKDSTLVPGYLRGAPEALDALLALLSRSNAIRSNEGDAHGKPPGASDVPPALANLAIHWAGAFIVYLADQV